ncbi:hypothetical protein CesoFtcFv8_017981 [Champsocephalus esox]|uniref:Uncharacterized protein n=1 Tax=Champsocephalus esox TaxID=159716 RepID=A0AAN8GSE2_9TELE|nr:hypothetical protein CesoFtcFv8_017981 [Champsocephalus esox]
MCCRYHCQLCHCHGHQPQPFALPLSIHSNPAPPRGPSCLPPVPSPDLCPPLSLAPTCLPVSQPQPLLAPPQCPYCLHSGNPVC